MDVETARAHIAEAIELLGIEVERVTLQGEPIEKREDCMAIELDRMDRALGGNTLLSHCARDVRGAFVELLAARDALARSGICRA